MNAIHKAYQVLGLDPGAPFEAVRKRYKRLAFIWHPDRMTNDEGRHEAEEELKMINHHFDALRTHFDRGHREGAGCECQPTSTSSREWNTSSASTGTSSQQSHDWEAEQKSKQGEEARRAREERCRQEQQAAWKAQQDRQAAEAAKNAMQGAEQIRLRHQQEQLRWRIAAAIALTYLLVLASSWLIGGAKQFIAGIQTVGQSQPTKNATATPGSSEEPEAVSTTNTSAGTDSYLPPEYHIPGKDFAWCRKFYDEEGRRLHERQEQERLQDISNAKNEIDRHQKAIDACNSSIADIQVKLWDPDISSFDKQKLQVLLEFRQITLAAEKTGLQSAQEKLRDLETARPAQTAPLHCSKYGENQLASPATQTPLVGGFFGDHRLNSASRVYDCRTCTGNGNG